MSTGKKKKNKNNLVETETLRHREAFNFYYSLGEKRCIRKVAREFHVSEQSVHKWDRSFNWGKRVEQRDIEIANKLERKTNNIILNTKADYRKEIKQNLSVVKAILANAVEEIKNRDIKANNVNDIYNILATYEKLVNLDLKLIGEKESIEVNLNEIIESLPETVRDGVRQRLIENASDRKDKT